VGGKEEKLLEETEAEAKTNTNTNTHQNHKMRAGGKLKYDERVEDVSGAIIIIFSVLHG